MRLPIRIALLLPVLALSGCAMAAIPVPPELASAPKLEVEGRQGWMMNQRIRFGPYATTRVERSSTRVREDDGVITTEGAHDQRFSFGMMENDAEVARVQCRAHAVASATSLPLGVEMSGVELSSLDCAVSPRDEESDHWTLELSARNGRKLAGTLEGDGERLDVVATTRLANASACCSTTGFYLRRAGRTVAAVEVVNDGGVWIDPALSADERRVVASAAAALLAFQALGEDFTRER